MQKLTDETLQNYEEAIKLLVNLIGWDFFVNDSSWPIKEDIKKRMRDAVAVHNKQRSKLALK